MYKVNSFFCGCGGFDLGFMQAGFGITGAWDIDKYAVQSYRVNLGDHVKQADITQMTAKDVPAADVWLFGFPCQDLSVAGKQEGLFEGKRSKLFFEVMRLLDETEDKPKIILAENVKQLKKYLPVLESEYAKRGYKMKYVLYNSKYWDVPQNRERYFVIGLRDDIEFEFPAEQHDYVPKLSSVLESNVAEKYYIGDEKAKRIIEEAMKRVVLSGVHATITPDRVEKKQNGRRAKANEEEMFTLTSQDLHGVIQSVFTTKDGCAYANDANYAKGVSPNYTGTGRRTHVIEITGKMMNYKFFPSTVSPTCDANAYKGLHASQGRPAVAEIKILDAIVAQQPSLFRVRKLTPREYFRLQGFPDTYQFVVSNSQLYKQAGNAVTVTVAKAIAENIKEALNNYAK